MREAIDILEAIAVLVAAVFAIHRIRAELKVRRSQRRYSRNP